jgi:small conductance mechanosensitive channel
MISTVVNMSRGHAQAVVDVGVGYGEDLDRAMAVMRSVGAELRSDPTHSNRILDDLEIAGVERWADSAVVLRARFRVQALEQWTVKREYLRRLKRSRGTANTRVHAVPLGTSGFRRGGVRHRRSTFIRM